MSKRKCEHCGYTFKLREEGETICELCRIQMRDDSFGHKYEFDVKYLSSLEIEGQLQLSPEKVVFKPKEVFFKSRKFEIAISDIRDVRFTTEKEISALRVLWLGVTLGVLLPKKHEMLTIDYEDDTGIMQHRIFKGKDIQVAIEELNGIRRAYKKKKL